MIQSVTALCVRLAEDTRKGRVVHVGAEEGDHVCLRQEPEAQRARVIVLLLHQRAMYACPRERGSKERVELRFFFCFFFNICSSR